MRGILQNNKQVILNVLFFIIKSPPTPLFQRGGLKADVFTVSLACSYAKECRLKPAPQ